jgi:prepilin-type N-terminal cleavage/methylation domain-containing protein/prepilin-type processing-associated H-X9-DG protein
MRQSRTATRGFTLIELLVVIAIIAVLAAILFPVFARARERGNESACVSNMRHLGTAAQVYADDNDGFMPPGHDVKAGDGPPDEGTHWYKAMAAGIRNTEILRCPTDPDKTALMPMRGSYGRLKAYSSGEPQPYTSYLINGAFTDKVDGRRNTLSTLHHPADTILFVERNQKRLKELTWVDDDDYHPWEAAWIWADNAGIASSRHHGGAIYLYADGHAHWRRFEETYTPNGLNQHLP